MDAGMHSAAILARAPPKASELDLSFLPDGLKRQCRALIKSYHEVHGFGSLPNMLWHFHMGPLIEREAELRQLLRKASTTRSTKKANDGFVQIASSILALEILASNFSGWSSIYPSAGAAAWDILKRNTHGRHMPLMDFYFYPPKHFSSAAIAALVPRASHLPCEADTYGVAKHEFIRG